MAIKGYPLKVQVCFLKKLCAVFIAGLFLEIGTDVSCMDGILLHFFQKGTASVFSSASQIFSKIPGVVPPVEVWGPELFSEWMVSKDPETYKDVSTKLYKNVLTKILPAQSTGDWENHENEEGLSCVIERSIDDGKDMENPRQNTPQTQQILQNMRYKQGLDIKNVAKKWLVVSEEEFCQRFPDYLKFCWTLIGGTCESMMVLLFSKWIGTSALAPFCECLKDGVFDLMCPSFFSGGKWLVEKYTPDLNFLYNSMQQLPGIGRSLSSLSVLLLKVPFRVAFYTGVDVLLPLIYMGVKNLIWCSKETVKDCLEISYTGMKDCLKKVRRKGRN